MTTNRWSIKKQVFFSENLLIKKILGTNWSNLQTKILHAFKLLFSFRNMTYLWHVIQCDMHIIFFWMFYLAFLNFEIDLKKIISLLSLKFERGPNRSQKEKNCKNYLLPQTFQLLLKNQLLFKNVSPGDVCDLAKNW